MEQVKNEIKKAVIKKDRLNVVYNERFSEANYTNVINKSCDQIIHSDLREAFSRLKLHLVVLCEQPEASNINKDSFTSPGYAETLAMQMTASMVFLELPSWELNFSSPAKLLT